MDKFSNIPQNVTSHPVSSKAFEALREVVENQHSSLLPAGSFEYIVYAKCFITSENCVDEIRDAWNRHFKFETCASNVWVTGNKKSYVEAAGRISCGFNHEYSIGAVLHKLAKRIAGIDFSHVEIKIQRIHDGLYFKGDHDRFWEAQL